jgi:thiamine biosynthesis lipoprotein
VVFQSPASFILHGVEDVVAKELTVECVEEMKRLEAMFSLQDPDSTLSTLNRDGVLRDVPEEFRSVVTLSLALGERSGGVFDPTIQPYWKFLHEGGEGGREEVMKLVDFRNVMVTQDRIAFAKDGMAMTLNGMAQGFVSDRIAEKLKAAGVKDALVNIGEYVAIGRFSKKRPWTLGIRSGGAEGEVVDEVPLEDEALAVSSGGGYRFGGGNHLVHPEGTFAKEGRVVAVTAPLAVVADGLATTCGLMSTAAARALVSSLDDTSLRVWEKESAGAGWEEVS